MTDIPLARALLLWNPGMNGTEPAFAVRALGSPDYWSDKFRMSGGACYRSWQELAADDPDKLLTQAMIELWHIAAFYAVPIGMIHDAMLAVPEYRNTLADDCLPKQFRHERDQ